MRVTPFKPAPQMTAFPRLQPTVAIRNRRNNQGFASLPSQNKADERPAKPRLVPPGIFAGRVVECRCFLAFSSCTPCAEHEPLDDLSDGEHTLTTSFHSMSSVALDVPLRVALMAS